MPVNQFLQFAASGGANVLDQATYAANTTLLSNGFQTGVAQSNQLNKVWRQSTAISAAIGQYINNKSGRDALDNGDIASLVQSLASAIALNSFAADTSTSANVILVALNPALPVLQDGIVLNIKPAITNTGGVTLNVNSLGAVPVQNAGGALVGSELVANKVYTVAYIASANIWYIIGASTTATTQPTGDNSTKIATTAFVKNQAYAPINSPNLTGLATAPTQGAGDNSNLIATTAFVKSVGFALNNSPGLTGAPTTPTPGIGDSSAIIPNTYWVRQQGYATTNNPSLTGNVFVPTYGAGTNNTLVASTAFVQNTVFGANGPIPAGTRLVFAQAYAPTGWTQDTSDAANNRMIRVVNSVGGGLGGSHDPSLMNVVPWHTHGFTTGTESALHSHSDSGHAHNMPNMGHGNTTTPGGSFTIFAASQANKNTDVGYANLSTESAYHTHSGGTDAGSSQTNWQPRYNNVIICQKN